MLIYLNTYVLLFSLFQSPKMAGTVRSKVLKVLNKQKNGLITAVRQKSISAPEKNILTSVFKDIPANGYTANDFVWQNLDQWPDKTATVS